MFLYFLKEELLSSQEKSPCAKDIIVKVDYSKKAETDTCIAFAPSSSERTPTLHKGNLLVSGEIWVLTLSLIFSSVPFSPHQEVIYGILGSVEQKHVMLS